MARRKTTPIQNQQRAARSKRILADRQHTLWLRRVWPARYNMGVRRISNMLIRSPFNPRIVRARARLADLRRSRRNYNLVARRGTFRRLPTTVLANIKGFL